MNIASSSLAKFLPRRPATAEDIVRLAKFDIERGRSVKFRHFVVEMARRNSENGVAHRQYSRSKLYVLESVPHVKHDGRMQRVTADVVTTASGNEMLSDLRLDSPHLPK
jgi:hypothetical protein